MNSHETRLHTIDPFLIGITRHKSTNRHWKYDGQICSCRADAIDNGVRFGIAQELGQIIRATC